MLQTFQDLIEATVEASKPPSNHKDDTNPDFNAAPFWKLAVLFEQLVLAPRPSSFEDDPTKESITQCIYRRLRWFRAGRIRDLHEESRQVISIASDQRGKKELTDSQVEKTAQLAADLDNWGLCNARLTKDTPVSQITDNRWR